MAEPDPLPCQRHLFDLPPELAYLNAAYMTPLLREAARAGEAGLARKLRPWTIRPADFFEESERVRALAARVLRVDVEGVAIVPSASYGIAVAAANLRTGPGRRVLVLADQFPSNLYAWRRLVAEQGGELLAVEAGPDGDLTAAVLDALDERVAIAALPQVRWTDGRLVDLERVGARCRALGVALVLDLTQSAGALPLDLDRVRPAFAVAATYKWLLGPYALGFLFVAPERRDGRPLEEGWIARRGAEDFTRLVDHTEAWAPGARRFDMGERSNFALLPVAAVALERILEWGVPRIAATVAALNRELSARLETMGLVTLPERLRGPHFLSVRLPEGTPADLVGRLARSGVFVSRRGEHLRVTPHLYNDRADIERLLAALAPFAPGGGSRGAARSQRTG